MRDCARREAEFLRVLCYQWPALEQVEFIMRYALQASVAPARCSALLRSLFPSARPSYQAPGGKMTREDLNPTALANAMVHLASFDWCGPHQTCVELCEFSTLVAAIDLTSKQFSEQANALHFSEVLGSQLAKRLKLLHSDTSSAGCFCDSYGPAADLRVGCAAECGCFGRRQVSAAKIVRLLNNYSASDAMSENLRKLTAAFSFTTAGSSAVL